MKNKIANLLKKHSFYIIILFAAAIRFCRLGKRDFWYDEAFTGVAVKENFLGMMKMIMEDVHPPLYYLSLKFFASFFDYSVFGIRLFSTIFGILCVWAVYLFTKELFGRKAALYASLIAAVSPFAIQYSQEGRMYSMFSFFIIIAAYFLVRALRAGAEHTVNLQKYKYSILFGLFLGLAALTHYMGIFFAPIFYLVYVIWNFGIDNILLKPVEVIHELPLQKMIRRLLLGKQILIGFLVAFIVFTPWIPSFRQHMVKNATSDNLDWIRPANFGDIPVNIQMFIFGTPLGEMSSGMPGPNEFYGIADISMWILVTVFMTAVIAYLLYHRNANFPVVIPAKAEIRKKNSEILFGSRLGGRDDKSREDDSKILKILTVLLLSLGFMALVWFLGFFGKYFFVARYLLAAGYFIFVLLGFWLSRIRLSYRALAIVFYMTMLFLIVPLGYSEGWNVFAKDLGKYKNNDFYILNSFDYVIAKYYLGADRLTLYNVDWPPYNPDYWAAIGPSLKRTEDFEDLRNDKNALIISNTQLGGQDNKNFNPAGLVLVAQYKNILIYKFQ